LNKLEILWRALKRLIPPKWPDDPAERRRMQAFMLGAGAGPAMRPGSDGKIHIEIEGGPAVIPNQNKT